MSVALLSVHTPPSDCSGGRRNDDTGYRCEGSRASWSERSEDSKEAGSNSYLLLMLTVQGNTDSCRAQCYGASDCYQIDGSVRFRSSLLQPRSEWRHHSS